jgi:hypothetical protein
MIQEPYSGRARIDFDNRNRFRIIIPSKKNWFVILFLTAWMFGWFAGESSALKDTISYENLFTNGFMIIWLIGWSIGGIFAVVVLLWTLFGRETLLIDGGILQLSKGLNQIALINKQYHLNNVKNLELNPESDFKDLFTQKKVNEFWGLTGGRIRFDYGLRTIKFGIGIDEAEARNIIIEIKKH